MALCSLSLSSSSPRLCPARMELRKPSTVTARRSLSLDVSLCWQVYDSRTHTSSLLPVSVGIQTTSLHSLTMLAAHDPICVKLAHCKGAHSSAHDKFVHCYQQRSGLLANQSLSTVSSLFSPPGQAPFRQMKIPLPL